MSGESTKPVADERATTVDVAGDPLGPIRALALENEAAVRQLRSAHIPQHVGMAAACRALAVELPRAIAAQVDADLKSGVLAQRWEAVRAAATEAGASGEPDAAMAALSLLLREQGRTLMRHLIRREKEWAADAYRLEGQADALEAQLHQLRRVAGPVAATDAGEASADAAPHVVAEIDAARAAAPVGGAR
jgi:hypothetical protein